MNLWGYSINFVLMQLYKKEWGEFISVAGRLKVLYGYQANQIPRRMKKVFCQFLQL
jgi:hypothetical protein